MPFSRPKLKMVVQGTNYAVATVPVKWTGSQKIDWKVKAADPTPVTPGVVLPTGRPFVVANWTGNLPTRTADLYFTTATTPPSSPAAILAKLIEWDKTFDKCVSVKVKMVAEGFNDQELIIDTECASHPLTQSLSALLLQVADLVGQAALLVLRWPLQLFRKPKVDAEELADESLVDVEAVPLKTTPPPGFEEGEAASQSRDKRGAA